MKAILSLMVGVVFSAMGCASAAEPTSASSDEALSAYDDMPEARSSTCRVNSSSTLIHVTVTVNEYRGIKHGFNGDHEIVEATIASTISVADPSMIDSSNVELAMNVASDRDPAGLPQEIPVAVGDTFELQGEYIPAATAHARNQNGNAAVIHFAHAPCGFVTVDGQTYR